MLNEFLSPIILSDGRRVFASPVGQGHLPMINLDDLGFYARYMFDHRKEFEGRDLEVSSEHVGWNQLVKTFTKVRSSSHDLQKDILSVVAAGVRRRARSFIFLFLFFLFDYDKIDL